MKNIGLLATCPQAGASDEAGVIADAAIVWQDGRILWAGKEVQLSPVGEHEEFDAGGRLVVPGLVDCHTHLAFGGWRENEFELRALGASYLDIARQGGGILSTVDATRKANSTLLFEKASHLAGEILALGVTSIECKSGYGLTIEDELKILRVYRSLSEVVPQRIVPTLLAAHTVPREYAGRKGEYVDLVCDQIIPAVADERLAAFCDVFVEESAFSIEDGRRVLEAGKRFGLLPKIHADQITALGGAELAAAVGAVSADHLEQVSDNGIRALASADVVAVSLPIASMYLGVRPLDGRRLLSAGIRVAVATDFNPGSAPSHHLPLALTLSCTMNRLTPAEALRAGTINAAMAIRRAHDIGSIEPGKRADFAVVEAESVNHWLYHFKANATAATFIEGNLVSGRLGHYVASAFN